MRIRKTAVSAAAAIGLAALVLAGCSTTPPATTNPTTPSNPGTTADPGNTADPGAGGGPDLAAATEFLAPYIATDKSLVIDEPLTGGIKPGLRVAYLDVGTPVAQLQYAALEEWAAATGVQLFRENIGSDPVAQQAAMDLVVQKGYDGLFNVTAEPRNFPAAIDELKRLDIPMIMQSVMHGPEFDLIPVFNGPEFMTEFGRAMAAAAIVRTNGEATSFSLYPVNEFEFTQFQRDGFIEEMGILCPDCTVRQVQIPITDVISQNNDRVITDLQANPDTDYYVLTTDEISVGMADKLRVGGVDTLGFGSWSIPTNITQVADGTADATFSSDLALQMWFMADQLFREINDQAYTIADPGFVVSNMTMFITQDSAKNYPGGAFIAIPDYKEQYLANWGL